MSFGRKLVSLLTLTLAVALFGTMAMAQDSPPPDRPDRPDRPGSMKRGGEMGGRGGQRMRGKQGKRGKQGNRSRRGQRGGMGMAFRDLNLSDAQKLQVQKLMESQRESGKAKGEEMRKLMMAQ